MSPEISIKTLTLSFDDSATVTYRVSEEDKIHQEIHIPEHQAEASRKVPKSAANRLSPSEPKCITAVCKK